MDETDRMIARQATVRWFTNITDRKGLTIPRSNEQIYPPSTGSGPVGEIIS
jgi:hypothetical protein